MRHAQLPASALMRFGAYTRRSSPCKRRRVANIHVLNAKAKWDYFESAFR